MWNGGPPVANGRRKQQRIGRHGTALYDGPMGPFLYCSKRPTATVQYMHRESENTRVGRGVGNCPTRSNRISLSERLEAAPAHGRLTAASRAQIHRRFSHEALLLLHPSPSGLFFNNPRTKCLLASKSHHYSAPAAPLLALVTHRRTAGLAHSPHSRPPCSAAAAGDGDFPAAAELASGSPIPTHDLRPDSFCDTAASAQRCAQPFPIVGRQATRLYLSTHRPPAARPPS